MRRTRCPADHARHLAGLRSDRADACRATRSRQRGSTIARRWRTYPGDPRIGVDGMDDGSARRWPTATPSTSQPSRWVRRCTRTPSRRICASSSPSRWSIGTASSPAPPAPARPRPCSSSRASCRMRACPVFVADVKGDLTGLAAPGDGANPKVVERCDVDRLDIHAAGPPGRVPVALGHAGRPGAGQRPLLRAAAAGQDPGPQRHPDIGPVARSSSTATTTTCRCSTCPTSRRRSSSSASDEGKPILADYGGMSPAIGRGAPAGAHHARAGGRRRLLRRARVRRRRT